jgi:hypothetical protein
LNDPSSVAEKLATNVAGLVVTTGGPICADALEQIRISAPKHAALLNNCLATPMADLNLISVSFVFIVAPLFCFSLVCFSFHGGSA